MEKRFVSLVKQCRTCCCVDLCCVEMMMLLRGPVLCKHDNLLLRGPVLHCRDDAVAMMQVSI